MKDSPTHSLFNIVNGKGRNELNSVIQEITSVNNRLAEEKIITEPQSTRSDINKKIFEKMTVIENIQNLSNVNKYMNEMYVAKTAEVGQLKNTLKIAVKDEYVNDVIGG